MAIRDLLKVSRKTFFNPSGWINFDAILQNNRIILGTLRGVFKAPEPRREESFQQALERLGIKETEADQIAARYYRWAVLFLVLSIVALLYTAYLFFRHTTFTGLLLGLAATALLLSQAFQYHFWSFQIRCRKLGATYKEWKQYLFSDESEASK